MFKNILYECDTELTLSCPNFGRKFNTDRYDHIRAKNVPFPSDYILAVVSSLVYNDEFYSLPDNWKLLTTARNSKTLNGYFGAAFWNPVLCQVVVAHRGTKDYNIGALRNDLQLGLIEEFSTSQSKSAATFVNLVSEQIKKWNKTNVIFQLSLTGHSLGAWLAQITAFTTKYFKIENNKFVEDPEPTKNIHAHAVVFESPGCRETLTNLVAPFCIYKKFSNFDKLDVTVYLSKLNFINCINHQIGTVYYLERAKTHEIKRILDLFDCRTETIEKQQVEYLRSGLKQSTKRFISSHIWPFKVKESDFQLKRAVDTEFSLNVFTETELDFLTDWNYAIKHDSKSVKEFKEKNSIPDFTVDLELNMIKGNDLNSTIGCIKHLRPTRTTVIDLLKNDTSEEIHMNILKMEIEHFRKHISDFNGYYFKDKYDIKEFLVTTTQNFFCIQIDMNSEIGYQLETSFVHNVLMCYRKNEPELLDKYFETEGEFCFLNWNQLNKIKRYLPSVLGKSKEKVNFLIIEWFDTLEENHEAILYLLKEAAKVIIISTQEYSWMKENEMVVKGLGNNISFQYLTEESQREFRKQNYLMLYDEPIGLDDIFREECFQNGEIYKYLGEEFLQFMLQSPVKPLIMDCNYKDTIENIVYMDFPYYEVNMTTLLLNGIDNRYLYIIENKEDYDLLREINQPNIKVSSEVEFETECRNNLDKVVYLFKIQDKKLCLNRIFNKDFYVCRNIMFKNIVNPDLFKTTNLECEHYYFSGNKAKYDALLSGINKDQQQFYNYCSTAEEAKDSITNLSEEGPVHLFNINGKRIEWRYTRGGIESLRKFMRLNAVPLKETEIITDQKLLIISGEPGMGKSSTVSCLYLHLKRTHWVFPILLRHSNFDSIEYPLNLNSAVRFLLTNSNTSDVTFIQCLLSYCLKHDAKPVYILFDGFDEVYDKENRLKFIRLVNFLMNESTAQVLITTRKFTCEELENELSVFACNYEVINSYKKKLLSFCWIFWRLFQDTIHMDEAKAHIRKILRDAPNVFGKTITAFIGIPMQIRMLTEVIASLHPHQFLELTLSDTISLYQKYTEVHCNIYFRRCSIPNQKIIEEWLTKCIFDELCKLAITEMFNLRTDFVTYEHIAEELNKVGIIQLQYTKYDNVDFGFLHNSVRDFFVAKLLKLWLEGQSIPIHYNWSLEKFIVSDFLIKGEHKEMRYFFNCYLKYLQVCKDRLEMCRHKLIELWNSNSKLLLENECRESIFHTCISENLYFVVRYFLLIIIDDVSKKTKLLSARNRKHQTPLFMSYRIAENDLNCEESILSVLLEELSKWEDSDIKVVLSSTLFAHFITTEFIEQFCERANKYPSVIRVIRQIKEKFKYRKEFIQACRLNNMEQVNDVLEKFKDDEIMRNYLLLTTNINKETGLYLTSNKQIVKRLIKLGCPTDTLGPGGVTPLSRAIQRKRTEVAAQLIKQGATTTPNIRGLSPLHYGAKYNNLHVLKLLFQFHKNLHVDERNIYKITPLMLAARYSKDGAVVKYLIDKGADISATDWNGMTPIYHAVAKNRTKLISLFRQRGADINVTDLHGTTPLLYSIKNKQKNMINCLLDNGADVNIGDAKGISPLQLLREMGEDKIIQKILNTVANTENGLK